MNEHIDLKENSILCLNFGYTTLISAKNEIDYRNAIINIYNGIELLIKHYLKLKNEYIIYNELDFKRLIHGRTDLIKQANCSSNTINFSKCIDVLKYFTKLPEEYQNELDKLGKIRNERIHSGYFSNRKKTKKLLITYIYPFINKLLIELDLEIKDFIKEECVDTLENYKKHMDDEIASKLLEKITLAKKHYFEELTEVERQQKVTTEDYTVGKYDKRNVVCPACKNNALLTKKLISHILREDTSNSLIIIKRRLVLKEFCCHYCGLNITNYDQLRFNFMNEEQVLKDLNYSVVPDDCGDCDCPDDCYDCGDCDCDCPDDCYDCGDCDCDCDCR